MTTEIDVCEFNSREAAKFALEGLLQVRAKAHALLLVLLGGAAGMASAGVGLFSSANAMLASYVAWSAIASAAWWCGLAAWAATGALRSSEVRAWVPKSDAALIQQWHDYAAQLAVETGKPASAIDEMRLSGCDAANKAAAGYRAASGPAYVALDRVYISMAATPLVWVVVCLLSWWVQRLG